MVLVTLSVLLMSVVLAGSPVASASPAPVQMNYACAAKSSGLMRYVSGPGQCTSRETVVTIAPGPVHVCIYFNFYVVQVPSLMDCTPAVGGKLLTLPPLNAPVYFCAATLTGALTYATGPGPCQSGQFLVVVPVAHQAPVLANIETSTLQYYAGTPAVPVTSQLTVSSTSAATLASATVTISSGLVTADDSLTFTGQNGITGSYSSGTGILTLTGTASLANYQTALRSVGYRDSDALTAPGTRTVSFQVNDGAAAHNLSNTVSRTIAVSTNRPPTAGNVSASTSKNTATNIDVLSHSSDPDGDTVAVASVDTTGTKGTVSVNGNGTIHYDPNGQFQSLTQGQTATDTFTYKVTDGNQTSSAATVTVTVTGANDLPVISNVETSPLSYQAQTPAVVVTSTLTISDDDDATMSGATVAVTAGLSSSDDLLTFTSQNGITGSYNATTGLLTLTGSGSIADYRDALRSVKFSTSDNAASPANRTISYTVTDTTGATSAPAQRVINVSKAAPTAADVSASTSKNAAVNIDVLSHATGPAGDTLTVASVDTTGTKGTVSVNGNGNGTIHYDPNGQFQSLTQGQTATDTFTYKVADGSAKSSSATVTVTINGANDLPVIANIEPAALSYQAQSPPVAITAALTISDDDATSMSGAAVAVTSGFSSGDLLSFTNQNGITGTYNAATGVLTLAGAGSIASYRDALRSVQFSTTDSAASPVDRVISFTVTDSVGATSAPGQRTINVSKAAPHAADVSASTGKNTATDIDVLSHATGPAGDTLTVASVDTTGTKGTVSVNGNGTIHYDPNGQFQSLTQGQTATDTFTYKVADGSALSSSATVTVTINGVSDLPFIANVEPAALSYQAQSPPVAITSTLTISDDDAAAMSGATAAITSGLKPAADLLSFTSQNGITGSYNAAFGMLTLAGAGSIASYRDALRSVKFSTTDGAASPADRTVSFTVTDSVGATSAPGQRTITVSKAAPTAADVSASTSKNAATDIDVLSHATGPAGDTLTVASVDTTGTKGTVSVNGNGTIHYDPNGQFQSLTQGQTATDTFTYKVADGSAKSSSATVTVTINGVNDLPVISNVETSPLSYQAQTPAVAITAALTISDDDATSMSGAVVSVTSGFSSGADLLSFTNQNGITGTYTASTGVLTLAGAGSIANYRDALRSVKFSTSDTSASPADRTVSFTVTDSVGATSTAAQRTINVSKAPDQPPVAVSQSYNAVGNTPLGVGTNPAGPAATVSGSVLTGDSDPDPSATLSVTANTSPAHGTLTMNPDGTFTYLPNAGYSGSDTFQYTIAGSNAPSQTATATVTITVGTLVWYTDDSKSAAGNGEAGTPFNTLAAANTAAGANSIIFLYQGSATYAGGVTLHTGEDLFGQPHGLTVSGYSLVTAGGTAPVITNGGGDGITLAQGADVEGVSVTSPTGNGITASSVNGATVGSTNAVAVSGAGGDGIHVSGGTGALDFGSTSVTGSAGHSVSVASRTGGTVTLGGHITDAATGVSLTGNTGATVAFTGTLTLSTGTHTAFTATGGGTVTATGSGSTVATTTATALTVTSTTIGAAGLTFRSVSSSGANPGISLSSTGTSGGLTVTGTGTAASGGTVQGSAGNGITLSSTTAPSFTDMVITNNAADGINGSQVNGLTLAGSTVSSNGTQANVSGNNNDGLDFSPNGTGSPNGLTGTVSITGSTITGSADNNAIISDTTGTLGLTVTGSSFTSNNSTTGNDGLHVDANGSTNATVSVTGSTFTNNFGDHFQFSSNSAATGTNSVTFSSNTLSSTVTGVLGGGVVISPFGNSHTTIAVNSNNIQKPIGNGIGIDEDGTSGTLSGTVNGNTVGAAAVANSGGGTGIGIFAEGSATETLAITNNNLFQYSNPAGIHWLDREGNPAMNLTVTGNAISSPGQFGSWGILGEDGALNTDNGQVCAAITGNSIKGSAQAGQGGADIELDQSDATTFKLPGYSGGSGSTSAVSSFLQGNNTGNGTPSAIASVSGSGGGFTGGSGC